jgi:hypothetical protein
MGPLVREIARSGRNLGGSLRPKRSNQTIQAKTFKPKQSGQKIQAKAFKLCRDRKPRQSERFTHQERLG